MGLDLIRGKREKLLFFAITSLGVSSIVTQLFLMREFLNVFYGNELVFGVILGNWLLLTGIGSYAGKASKKVKDKTKLLVSLQLLIAVLPFFSLAFIRALRMVLVPGEAVDFAHIFLSSFVILLPYCVISGFLLTLACSVFSLKRSGEDIGKVYLMDNIGDILGGFLFSFILVFLFDPFQMAFFLLFLILVSAYFLGSYNRNNMLRFIVLVSIVFSLFLLPLDLNSLTLGFLFPSQTIVFQKSSPYGYIVVTETSGQLNFFENGLPLFSTENTIENEENVHYAMVQREKPRNILLISGGVAGTTSEILKYNVTRVDYVELDPLIIELGKAYTNSLDDERIRTFMTDGRMFVKFVDNEYDVVIIDLPDPSTAQLNRFYSLEFFREVKRILSPSGVVSLSLSSSPNYMNYETIRLNAIVYRTLKSVFEHVIVIPSGDENYFLASDSPLSYNISGLVKERGTETKYVNEHYLKGKLTEERINYVRNAISREKRINTDFVPLAYYYHLLYWESEMGGGIWIVFVIAIILVFLLLRSSPIPFAISTTGFAASSLEVILLIGFQILYGYVYQYVGVIVAFFMLGLAIGAYYANLTIKKRRRKDMVKIELSIFLFSLSLPFVLLFLSSLKNEAFVSLSSLISFPILTLIISALVGFEFPIASKLHTRKKEIEHTAGVLYASDLIGATIGALITSTFLIPILGVINTCVLVGITNLVSGVVVWKTR